MDIPEVGVWTKLGIFQTKTTTLVNCKITEVGLSVCGYSITADICHRRQCTHCAIDD